MKRFVLALAMTVLATACGPKATAPEKTQTPATEAVAIAALPDPTGACAAKATYAWKPTGGGSYEVTGAAGGADCQSGSAVITVRNAQTQKVLLSQSVDVGVMTNTIFADLKSPEGLKKGLDEWIAQDDDETTATMPEWRGDAEMPMQGEFAFYPQDGTTRAAYAALRSANLPTFCFVQGGESLACYALDRSTDELKKVGLQTFPG